MLCALCSMFSTKASMLYVLCHLEKYLEACKIIQDLSNFSKVILGLMAIQETFKIIEKYLEACKTIQDLSNFRKAILSLLVIQETFENHTNYLKACKTFQDLSNFRKTILELLAIQETFKNHTKIYWSFHDVPGLVKIQESYLGPSDNPGDFQRS